METEKRVGMKEMFPAGVPMLERSHDPSTSLGMTSGETRDDTGEGGHEGDVCGGGAHV